VKDIQFVDAVSGTPLGREDTGYAPPSERRMRSSNLGIILVSLIALIIFLVLWAFS
jgi:hypothetical protein